MDLVYKLTSRKALAVGGILLLVLLAVLATLVDWRMVVDMLSRADRPMLAAAILLLIIGYVVYAVRWYYLLGGRIGFLPIFHTANAGTLVNVLLPGSPGNAVRIFLLGGKTGAPLLAVTSSVVVERWYEQIMRLACLGGALIFGAGAQISLLTTLGSVSYLIFSFLLMVFMLRRREWVLLNAPGVIARLPRITEERARGWLADLIEGLSGISSPRRLFATLLWSIFTWSLFWGFHVLCLLSLHPYLPPNQLLAISLGSLALVPPSATTVPGVYQMSMVVPLALVGYGRSLLTSYSLVMNVLEMVVVILLGLWGTFATGLTLHQLLDKARDVVADELSVAKE